MEAGAAIEKLEKVGAVRRGSLEIGGESWRAMQDYIFVADYGAPNKSHGGLFLGDGAEFGIYRYGEWRFGSIIAVGPGRYVEGTAYRAPMDTSIQPGSTLMFSRKHGTRTGYLYKHPEYGYDLYIRVLDTMKAVAIVDDFEPWWNVKETAIHPDAMFSG